MSIRSTMPSIKVQELLEGYFEPLLLLMIGAYRKTERFSSRGNFLPLASIRTDKISNVSLLIFPTSFSCSNFEGLWELTNHLQISLLSPLRWPSGAFNHSSFSFIRKKSEMRHFRDSGSISHVSTFRVPFQGKFLALE